MSLPHDLRHAVRTLARTPGFSAVAVLVLAAGIGINSAVFSLADALLFRPREADRVPGVLVGLYSRDRDRPDRYRAFSYPEYADIRDSRDVFSDVLAHTLALVGVTHGEITRRAFADLVSWNYFETLGARLAAGRAFTPDEEQPGRAARVAIVSHAFWQRRGGRADMLGGSIRLNGADYTVVGITAPGFTGTSVLISPEIYLPLGLHDLVTAGDTPDDPAHTRLADRETYALLAAGRLQPGLAVDQAAPALDALGRHLSEAYPGQGRAFTIVLHPLPRVGVGTSPQGDGGFVTLFLMFQTMAAVVLLVACLNLANLLLARARARRREMGVRLALGASRARVARQLLVDGFVLSLAGGAAGLALASWSARLLVSALTSSLVASPLTGSLPLAIDLDVGVDARVLALTLGLAVAATSVFGLWPALRLTRPDVVAEMKRQAGDTAGRTRWWSAGHAIVVSQIALSLALLTAAGLLLRSAVDVAGVDPGFAFRDGLVAGLDPGLAGYDQRRGREALGTVLERVRALPETGAASLASVVAYAELTEEARVARPGAAREGAPTLAVRNVVSADYFSSLGLKMRRGREFTPAEEASASAPPVAILDEPLAERLFGGEDPLGREVVLMNADGEPAGPALEIVGVAPGLRQNILDRAPVAHVYTPTGREYRARMTLHVRLAGGGREAEAAALTTVRQAIREADDRLPVLYLEPLEGYRATNFYLWLARLGAKLFGLFAALAVGLALVGLYGVKAYLVSLRTREIGIRVALGAAPRNVLWLVMKDGAVLAGAGVVAGFGLAIPAARVLSSLVYRASPFDPVVFSGAAVLLFAAAMLATYLPARRATKVEPTVALRAE